MTTDKQRKIANADEIPEDDPINDPGNEDPGSVIDPDLPSRHPVPPREPGRPNDPVQEPQKPGPERS